MASDDFIYFGELREKDECIYNISLLTDPVSFSLKPQRIDVRPRECNIEEKVENVDLTERNYRCDNARIQCLIIKGNPLDPNPRGCEAVIEDRSTTYVCSSFVNIVGEIWTGNCRVIRNFLVTDENWLTAREKGSSSMFASIGITTIADTKNTTLKFQGKEVEATQVHYAWFVLFGAKVCLVLALAGFTAYLVRTGARCVVHDEKSLASLLSATVYRYSTFGQDDSIYLNAKTNARRTVFWASTRPHRRRANQELHSVEEAVVRGTL